MNFLVHSLYATTSAELAGQFLGDFVRGRNLDAFPVAMQQGIRQHRLIDSITDAHAATAELRSRFDPPYRRVAGIVIDVYFDHVLARQFLDYTGVSLVNHVAEIHGVLDEHHDLFPPALVRFSEFARQQRIFESNVHVDGVSDTLQRLARRSPALRPLADSVSVAAALDNHMQLAFDRIIQDLDEHEIVGKSRRYPLASRPQRDARSQSPAAGRPQPVA